VTPHSNGIDTAGSTLAVAHPVPATARGPLPLDRPATGRANRRAAEFDTRTDADGSGRTGQPIARAIRVGTLQMAVMRRNGWFDRLPTAPTAAPSTPKPHTPVHTTLCWLTTMRAQVEKASSNGDSPT
jgi:hypothetical protein